MSFISVLVLFLAVISLTNIEGNPKQQIHVKHNGLISNQLPIIEPHTGVPDNRRSLIQVPPSNPIPRIPPNKPPQQVPPRTPPEEIGRPH
jgi:hypothetical protein